MIEFLFPEGIFFFCCRSWCVHQAVANYTPPFFFCCVCVCVVLGAVGFSFGKYNSLLLFAGLFFFTFILPPFSVCVQFWVLCVVWHVQQSVSFLNFVCLFVPHFVMWVWVVTYTHTHTHTSGVAKSTIGRWANPLVFFFFLLSATWASKKPKKMNVVDDDLDWDGGEVDFSLRAWMGEGEGEWTLTREATFFFFIPASYRV